MLFSIIPPMLVILSLIGLIVFLMKKSKKAADLSVETPEEKIFREQETKAGFFRKIFSGAKSIKGENARHFFLAVLEKITRSSRIIFLKLESRFGGWSSLIREKRKKRIKKGFKGSEIAEDDAMRRLQEYEPGKSAAIKKEKIGKKAENTESKTGRLSIEDLKEKNEAVRAAEAEEKIVKPIISEKVASPRPRTEIKDRLEELLIERIAVNPKDIEAYERLGEYYLEIRSLGDAKECFKQVLKLDPGNRNGKYRMRRLENLLAKK